MKTKKAEFEKEAKKLLKDKNFRDMLERIPLKDKQVRQRKEEVYRNNECMHDIPMNKFCEDCDPPKVPRLRKLEMFCEKELSYLRKAEKDFHQAIDDHLERSYKPPYFQALCILFILLACIYYSLTY